LIIISSRSATVLVEDWLGMSVERCGRAAA